MARNVLLGLFVLCVSIYLTECGRFGSFGRGIGRTRLSFGKGWGGSARTASKISKPISSNIGSRAHSYPPSHGYSGANPPAPHNYPRANGPHNYLSGSGLKNTNTVYGTNTYHVPNTYYTAPQHIYVTQYRDSGSRYGDLLTGLTMYNMGRSHSHYHDHYYYDDHYRSRYYSSNNNYQSPYSKPNDEATCTLRIQEYGNLKVLKIPCEIVSTFTKDGKIIENESQANHTVCTSNSTVISATKSPISTTESSLHNELKDLLNRYTEFNKQTSNHFVNVNASTDKSTDIVNDTTATVFPIVDKRNKTRGNLFEDTVENSTDSLIYKDILSNVLNLNASSATVAPIVVRKNETRGDVLIDTEKNSTDSLINEDILSTLLNFNAINATVAPIVVRRNETRDNVVLETVKTVTETEIIVNITTCIKIPNYTDPLSEKGSPIDPSNMECSVDIRTKTSHIRNKVDCKTLMEYSKMPAPKNEDKLLLPSREKLKAWMDKPPWWLSTFIAV